MSKKELKAFEEIWKDFHFKGHNRERYLRSVIVKALKPPTAEEVCVELSKYLKPHYIREVKVAFENNEFVFFDGILVQYIGGNIWLNFPLDFPPRLITLIGKFYEGVEYEWKQQTR